MLGDIAQLVTAGAAVGALWLSWRNQTKLRTVERKQDEQHRATNSRFDDLLVTRGLKERAEGKAEGLKQGRDERP